MSSPWFSFHPLPDMLGQPVDVRAVLHRSASRLVVVDGFVCYPQGVRVELNIALLFEPAFVDPSGRRRFLVDIPPGKERLSSSMAMERSAAFSVEWSDGESAVARGFGGSHPPRTVTVTSPQLRQFGSMTYNFLRDHTRNHRFEYWVAPLPPPGRLVFGFEWAAIEIAPGTAEVDADALRHAASDAKPFW